MSIVTEKYTRKPFSIEAIRVTEENMEGVAKWCGGELHEFNGRRFIKVDVTRPLTEKQTRAFSGDWVLKSENRGAGFKVYTHKAFLHCFDKLESDAEQLTLFDEEHNCVPEGCSQCKKPSPKIHMPARYPEPSTR